MMTACDLSAIAKPWEIQSKVTQMSEELSCAAFLIMTQHLRTCGFQQSTLKTEEDVKGIAISMEYHFCNGIFLVSSGLHQKQTFHTTVSI